MESPRTVKQLFAPLGNRLYTFESNDYSSDYSDEYSEWENHIDYTIIIREIVKVLDEYDPKEVYEESKFYLSRVTDIQKNIKPLTTIVMKFRDGGCMEKEVPKGTQEIWFKKWQDDLEVYQTQLNSIIDISKKRIEFESQREYNNSTQNTTQKVNQINLPENFTVKQLQVIQKPKLSLSQSALFLYYLRDSGILPSYSDASLGKLAEAFLVRNEKTIRDGFTDIYNLKRKKDDLELLKLELQSLLKAIDEDLKKTR